MRSKILIKINKLRFSVLGIFKIMSIVPNARFSASCKINSEFLKFSLTLSLLNMLCYVMLCYVVLCYIMACYVV